MDDTTLLPPLLAFVLSPLLVGVVNRTKARLAGRTGAPLFQVYHDLGKLLGKGAVYGRSTTWVFRAGPIVTLAAIGVATLLLPFGNCPAPLRFTGDLVLFVGLLGLARLFTVLAALDTGSSFEGMSASRGVLVSALAEPALLLGLAALARTTHVVSLSQMHAAVSSGLWQQSGLVLTLVAVALAIVFFTENAHDDLTTQPELATTRGAMVLDHGGPDLAFLVYAQALKLWVLGSLIVGMLVPARSGWLALDAIAALAGMVTLAVVVGLIDSTTARLRLRRVPQLLVGAAALSCLALILEYGKHLA